MINSKFTIRCVNADAIFITDDCCSNEPYMSVTNDAGQVTRYLYDKFGDKRIFYRDSTGRWDELVHEDGAFTRYSPGVPTNMWLELYNVA